MNDKKSKAMTIKADEVEYEPIFYDWLYGELVHLRKLKRKWYVSVGGYYATGKTKKAAYKKAKKLYDERNIEKRLKPDRLMRKNGQKSII